MAKVQKITSAEISARIIETYKDEEAAEKEEAMDTAVEISTVKTNHTNWRKIKDE
jgi:hypothetical protein